MVQVSDGAYSDSIVVNVTINEVNDAPVFDRETMEFTNGVTEVGQVRVSDVDNAPIDHSFTLTGGADWLLFDLKSDGILSFKNPPDIKSPGDNDADNRYEISVQVDDGEDTTEADITVLPGGCMFYTLPAPNGKTIIFCL